MTRFAERGLVVRGRPEITLFRQLYWTVCQPFSMICSHMAIKVPSASAIISCILLFCPLYSRLKYFPKKFSAIIVPSVPSTIIFQQLYWAVDHFPSTWKLSNCWNSLHLAIALAPPVHWNSLLLYHEKSIIWSKVFQAFFCWAIPMFPLPILIIMIVIITILIKVFGAFFSMAMLMFPLVPVLRGSFEESTLGKVSDGVGRFVSLAICPIWLMVLMSPFTLGVYTGIPDDQRVKIIMMIVMIMITS